MPARSARRRTRSPHKLAGPEGRLAGSEREIARWTGRCRAAVRKATKTGALAYSVDPDSKNKRRPKKIILVADALAWVRSQCANADAVAAYTKQRQRQQAQHVDHEQQVSAVASTLARRARARVIPRGGAR